MSEDNKPGDYLRTIREAAGLSQSQLAAAVGVDKGYISLLESGGRKNPSAQVLYKLALAAEVRPADVFLRFGIPVPAERPSLDALLRADYDLPDDGVAEVRAQIEAIAKKYRSRKGQEG